MCLSFGDRHFGSWLVADPGGDDFGEDLEQHPALKAPSCRCYSEPSLLRHRP